MARLARLEPPSVTRSFCREKLPNSFLDGCQSFVIVPVLGYLGLHRRPDFGRHKCIGGEATQSQLGRCVIEPADPLRTAVVKKAR